MKVYSLTRQTIVIVLTAQLLCSVVLSGFIVVLEARAHLRAFDVGLRGRSDSLLGAIQDAEDVSSSVEIDPAELRVPPHDVFAVYTQGGGLLGRSAEAPPELIERRKDGFRTERFRGERYRVFQREGMRVIDRAEFGGVGLKRPVTILYASPENRVWHAVFSSVSYSLVAIFVVAAVTMVLIGLFLRKALGPLSELALAAGQVSAPSICFEPPASALQVRELRPLAEVLTESVARLRATFDKEQRFVGDAAHELKTAVAVVRSSVQLLMLRRRSHEEYEAGLQRVLEDTERVEGLVSKMLELASVAESRQLDSAKADLSAVATQVVQELAPVAEKNGVTVQGRCASDALVPMPSERARTLISNLVMNAIQHSSRGSSVLVCVRSEEPGLIVLTVSDCGSGIGEAALPHIFDRYYREDQSRSRETGGTGLGLAICKAIVDAAGGTIRVASEANAGTTMTVELGAA